jgi:hypothetical protein
MEFYALSVIFVGGGGLLLVAAYKILCQITTIANLDMVLVDIKMEELRIKTNTILK